MTKINMLLVAAFAVLLALVCGPVEATPPHRFPVHVAAGQSDILGNYAPDPTSAHPNGAAPPLQLSAYAGPYRYQGVLTTFPTTVASLPLREGGAEIQFGRRIYAAGETDAVIVKSGLGGSALYNQWQPHTLASLQDSPWEELLERMDREVAHGGRIASFLWWQGYTDAQSATHAPTYEASLRTMIAFLRARYGVFPFYIVELNSRHKGGNPGALLNLAHWDDVHGAQIAVCDDMLVPDVECISADAVELQYDVTGADPVHTSAHGQDQMGDIWADRYLGAAAP